MVYTFVYRYCNGLVLWLVVLDVVHRTSETEQLHLKISADSNRIFQVFDFDTVFLDLRT